MIDSTSTGMNATLAQRFVDSLMESWAGSDNTDLLEFLDDDLEYFDDGMPAPVRGKSAADAFFRECSSAISDFQAILIDGPFVHPTKPMIMIHWRYGGRHTADWNDWKATGNVFSLDGASRYEFRDGKVVNWRCMWDTTEMLAQLGLVGA